MNFNTSLIAQMVMFLAFIWFCMTYVWPPLMAAISERQQRIADGLDAADKAQANLANAQQQVEQELAAAKAQSATIIEQAHKRADKMIEDAKVAAAAEAERIKLQAKEAVDREVNQAREQLRGQVANLAVQGAEKILLAEVNASAHNAMLEQLAGKL